MFNQISLQLKPTIVAVILTAAPFFASAWLLFRLDIPVYLFGSILALVLILGSYVVLKYGMLLLPYSPVALHIQPAHNALIYRSGRKEKISVVRSGEIFSGVLFLRYRALHRPKGIRALTTWMSGAGKTLIIGAHQVKHDETRRPGQGSVDEFRRLKVLVRHNYFLQSD